MCEAILSMQVPHVDSILDNPLYLGACGQAATAGEGDEEILFSRLRGTEPKRVQLSFRDGSFGDRKVLMKRALKFFWRIDSQWYRGTLGVIAPDTKEPVSKR